ncbi:OLC1v1017595C1 [Oldenlandia corymbosa var. corymbosa]|uniref:OLC1v1017595C1 n=1 Tax=Oldenlandia corymbosa var. corymbosa TaxID=529605 RepID=A0AAV1E9V9_OLDCO|nr:OLC1v1017595C1 [Oldenlandia corymbosa var. corymbosa]
MMMVVKSLPHETTTFKIWFIHTVFLVAIIPAFCSSMNTDTIATCLANKGVKNFTLFPNNHDEEDTSWRAYYSFLNFSIQNLRFAESSVPKPIAIVMPETKEELVNSVICCRKGSWEIRVRCGGHSYEGTSSVATDGIPFVIIDLMNLDRVSIDLESGVAWVEGGAILGKTYYAISEASKVHGFSAGSCPTVGIGGHISGGGFGLLSRKYGLAADNVVDAVLIDADGRVLNRESMGEEVFWAIRGGGGGVWGIVYAWKIRLLDVPKIVTGCVISRPGSKGHVARLVEKWQHVSPNLGDDFYLSVFVGAGLPERAPAIGISATFKGFYLGPKAEFISEVNRVFPELSIAPGDCKEMSWIESVVYFSGLNVSNAAKLTDRYLADKLYFKAKSDYVKSPISRAGIRLALDVLEEEPKGYVILDPYGGFMDRIDYESIPFPHRKGNLFSIQYMVEWKKKDLENLKMMRRSNSNSNGYVDWIRKFYDAMAPYVSSAPRAAYINYMDLDLGVMTMLEEGIDEQADGVAKARLWGEKYFLKNYDRLVRAKTIVDPLNVFRNQQGIPPLSLVTASSSSSYSSSSRQQSF